MYLIFAGTTDYLLELEIYLSNIPHSLFKGTGTWENQTLNSQLIVCFNKKDANNIRDFLLTNCQQKEVPFYKIEGSFI